MAKKAKGNRVQVILECTEMKDSGMPGNKILIRTEVLDCFLRENEGHNIKNRYEVVAV